MLRGPLSSPEPLSARWNADSALHLGGPCACSGHKKRARHPHCCGCRANTWRRPTLTGPVVPIPSALQRFTSGFGMGPGGSTALWPPEDDPVPSGPGLWPPEPPSLAAVVLAFSMSGPLPDIHTENFIHSFNLNSSHEPCAVALEQSDPERNQAGRMISTGKLHPLLHFHFRPINVVVFHDPSGKTHLGRSLALRCFQRLSRPNLATRPCR